MSIHPLAIVSPRAKLGRDVTIGPFCLVEDEVTLGDGCRLESRVTVKSGSVLGPRNHLFEGAVVGGLPQHTRPPEKLGTVLIGEGNTLRENATVHRALKLETPTTIGDHNYLMVGAHIAHDCRVGNHIVMANGTMLGGHVAVDDRAFLSGNVAVHQFCRIGGYAMVGGHARVVQDVPPYVTIDGGSGHVVGLNLVGLRRNGFTSEQMAELKAAYRLIYRRGLKWAEVVAELQAAYPTGPAAAFHRFFATGSRGFVQERRLPPNATLKLRRQEEPATEGRVAELKSKVG